MKSSVHPLFEASPFLICIALFCGCACQVHASLPFDSDDRITLNDYKDSPGNDFASIPSTNLVACRTSCSGSSKCAAFTFNKASGACWLKSSVVGLVDSEQGITGVKSLVPSAELEAMAPFPSWQQDVDALLAGVSNIDAPGVPGPITVFGESAFPIVVGKTDGGNFAAVVAGSRVGAGRVVIFGHDGYFRAKALSIADTGHLIKNAVVWSAGENKPKVRVGVMDRGDMYQWSRENGLSPIALQPANLASQLKSIDVLIAEPSRFTELNAIAVRTFIDNGGGFVGASLGWGWSQLHPGMDLATEHGGNRLLAPVGLVWADGYLERNSANGFDATKRPTEFVHAGRALNAVSALPAKSSATSPSLIADLRATVSQAIRSVPPTDKLFLPRLSKITETTSLIVPTEKNPFKPTLNLLGSLAASFQLNQFGKLPPESIKAHPAAEFFPGSVSVSALRISKVVEVDNSIPGWHSTGLYAVPGEPVYAKLDRPLSGLSLRIGSHTDNLSDLDSWSRMPQIVSSVRIASQSVRANNAFGGLVYIEVGMPTPNTKVNVEIIGAVDAPLFILGKTNESDWKGSIRNFPGPWAEIATSRVILTVPSQYVRKLENPEALARFWDQVLDSAADLAGISHARNRPERYVADVQLSKGYMHSGYPIMTHLDAAERMIDLNLLRTRGDWGIFHELGHNHQSADWTFAGSTEVTVNLFTMYVIDHLISDYKPRADLTPVAQNKRWNDYRLAGSPFEQWKAEPFLALIMYRQLIDAFGWDSFKRVFAEYRSLSAEQRPKTDDEKRDQWLLRMSRTVNRNLSNFFDAWGVPTSIRARSSLADLPSWMPPSK